jgi:hypothetical protein
MALSNEYSFNPDMAEILEEAYDRAGLEFRSGYDARQGRRSIQYLTLEWANKGLNLWTIEEVLWADPVTATTTLTKGQADYDLDLNTISVLDVIIRTDAGLSNQADYTVTRISRPTYIQTVTKLAEGRPVQYMTDRREVKNVTASTDRRNKLSVWPTPDRSSTYQLIYWRLKRMTDPGSGLTNTLEIPDRFYPAFVAGLAYHTAAKSKVPEARAQKGELRAEYMQLFKEAKEEDREKANFRFVPKLGIYRNR